jgi:hypothetical protein
MGDVIGGGFFTTKAGERVWTATAILLGILLFIAMSQPIWRGEEMVAQFKTNCDKRGGVLLENKGIFGITYQCASHLD